MAAIVSTRLGLTHQEAQKRLLQYGLNTIPEKHQRPLLIFLGKLWGIIPWMLEATMALQLILGRYVDAVIVLALLFANAVISFVQENRAQNALAALHQSLTVQSRVLRNGQWALISAQQLVPGDVVHLRTGDVIPADMRLIDGQLSVDQSTLTGESLPVEIGAKAEAYAGSLVKRGESTAEVTVTGPHTKYGKTAELVVVTKTEGHLDQMIQTIVKYLVAVNAVLMAMVLVYTMINHLLLTDMLPFILILIIASVPVALPATFTLASAVGSLELGKQGVLLTRLSALHEAAGMDVLCTDKTGTLTRNELALIALHPYPPYTEADLLKFAALASDDATQDPIDLAVVSGARQRGTVADLSSRVHFAPFDSATKRTEATVRQGDQTLRVVKGFPQVIASLIGTTVDLKADVEQLASQGYRVLAVAAGPEKMLALVGLLGLQDPPRTDSKAIVQKLGELGIRLIMVTGDSLATAKAVAAQVGIEGAAFSTVPLPDSLKAKDLEYAIFAGVFPEDKFKLVQALQKAGHVVGMTGDGVNDAPALKQAEVGVAVANATDVAKAAASLVLTRPGLSDMVAAVEVGRQVYQRMLTYILNKIIKTFQMVFFLSLGLLLLGIMVTSPRLMLLLFFATDFVTVSLATDHVSFSPKPDHWNIRALMVIGLVLAAAWLVFAFGVLLVGKYLLTLPLAPLQTLVLVMLVFSGQANMYSVRERHHFWHSRPSRWLMLSTALDVLIVSWFALQGWLMTPIGFGLIAGLFGATIAYMIALDFLKIRVFRRFLDDEGVGQ